MKSFEIPDLLVDGLNLQLTDAEIEKFHNARQVRNSIAHGETITLTLQKAGEINDVLKLIAYKLDKHLNEHFLINENFS
ncbi:hypothetical protein AMR72_00020 [Flavobacterium psychrophilum]|nr:hypothetical protein AMR72_00020 [Flavobacterium psychrophilum]AOE51043.1 hypothetical protein ALW18_00020 [Flavobacterium psychrophilum]